MKPLIQAQPPQPPCLSAKPAPLRPPTCHTSTVLSIPWLICNACETSHTSTAPINPPAYLQNLSHCLSAKPVPLLVTQAQSSQVACISATPVKPLIQAQPPQPPCLSAKPVALLICETRPPTCHTSTVLSIPLLICNACETSHTSTVPYPPAYLQNLSHFLSAKPVPLPVTQVPPSPQLICNACETSQTSTVPSTPGREVKKIISNSTSCFLSLWQSYIYLKSQP